MINIRSHLRCSRMRATVVHVVNVLGIVSRPRIQKKGSSWLDWMKEDALSCCAMLAYAADFGRDAGVVGREERKKGSL